MFKKIFLVWMIIVSTQVLAVNKLTAVITKNQFFSESHGYALVGKQSYFSKSDARMFFPEENYVSSEISLSNLNYQNDTKKNEFYKKLTIDAVANLRLIAFDKKTGYFKYSLSLQPKTLENYTNYEQSKSLSFKGKVIFNQNKKPELLLEGKVLIIEDKLVINNSHSYDNTSFELAVKGKEVCLKQIEDASVTVLVN